MKTQSRHSEFIIKKIVWVFFLEELQRKLRKGERIESPTRNKNILTFILERSRLERKLESKTVTLTFNDLSKDKKVKE